MRIEICTGQGIAPHLADLARLRIAVFRAYPYRYDGHLDYEIRYLDTYARSPDSLFVLAIDDGEVVGASTGVPLRDETAAIRTPFLEQGISVDDVFYFGESVLLPAYRGRGFGHRFFDERERRAGELGCGITAFCSVLRAPADPHRPADYRSNDAFWTGRGYRPHPHMRCRLSWQELGEDVESEHELAFWLRDQEARP